ncbi:hypothetical protein SFRURICE_014147 [Spodoptera frugiperda]|nr:hypothetical protein SFRURICE_014147 [Spodoptera frugiperda]
MQLSEQTRVLEARAEATAGVAGELHDYCRRRADLEHDYARALDKLARAAAQRHKDQKHKREQWSLTSGYACWQAALEHTRGLARDHAALADLYAGPLAARLQRAADDALRLHRKCRDIVTERHEEVGAALGEAAGAGKAHAAAAADWRAAALKLRHAYDQRQRVAAVDPPRHKKLKALDKELEKRRARHRAAHERALRARADYVLSLEAANATLQRYYLDDIADIILVHDTFHILLYGPWAPAHGSEACGRAAAPPRPPRPAAAGPRELAARASCGRARPAFTCARCSRRRTPTPHVLRTAPRPSATQAMLAVRSAQMDAAARQLRAECREHAKTLDAAEAELIKQRAMMPPGTSAECSGRGAPASAPWPRPPRPPRTNSENTPDKFPRLRGVRRRLAPPRPKARPLCRRRLAGRPGAEGRGAARRPPPRRAPRAGCARSGGPRWQAPPPRRARCRAVRSSPHVRLAPQAVFACPRSHVGERRSVAFERRDPVASARDASDMNSVCGLLKLYLRELRPPLLPPALQERLRPSCAACGPRWPRCRCRPCWSCGTCSPSWRTWPSTPSTT